MGHGLTWIVSLYLPIYFLKFPSTILDGRGYLENIWAILKFLFVGYPAVLGCVK